MVSDGFVGHGQETAVRTLGALDFTLVAEISDPLIRANGTVAGLAGLSALEPARVHVLATAEQGPEQSDLGVRGGSLVNRYAWTRSSGVKKDAVAVQLVPLLPL
jgi:hypothetical protein